MRAQAPLKEKTTFNRDMANRYRLFREKYVDKNQEIAAEILGIHQTTISKVESAQIGIGAKSTKVMVEKYNLSTKWLTTGSGDDRVLPKNYDSTLRGKNITQLRNMVENLEGKVLTIEKQMQIMQATTEFFIKRIEQLTKDLQK